ncbi:hypothetical protein ACEPAH_7152 [Sanghuangporus vaninii]
MRPCAMDDTADSLASSLSTPSVSLCESTTRSNVPTEAPSSPHSNAMSPSPPSHYSRFRRSYSRASSEIVYKCSRTPSPCPYQVDAYSKRDASQRLLLHINHPSPPNVSSSSDQPATVRSDRFWFEDGTVVIRVEDTLYKLYKGILARQSNFFKSKITAVLKSPPVWIIPTINGKSPEVTRMEPEPPQLNGYGSESSPINVNVGKSDFELILSLILPSDYVLHDKFTLQEWSGIAAAARTTELSSIYNLAVNNILGHYNAMDLINIGRSKGIEECYTEGFRVFCTREASLSLEEGRQLGVDCIIAIAHARDKLAKGAEWSEIESSIQFECDE